MATEWQKRQYERLHQSGYLDVLSGMLRRMNVAFWWSGVVEGNVQILNNGTICYLDTGTRRIGVTADHVYAKFLEQRSSVEGVELQLGGSTIDIEPRLIDRDKDLDLATFDIPEVFTSGSDAYFHSALKWPVPPVTGGEVVVHGGYPQVLRNQKSGEVEFPFQYFASAVNEVKPSSIIVVEPGVERAYWPGHDGEEMNRSFRGQSGGPVYRLIDGAKGTDEPIDRLELVGFIYNQLHDLVLARPSGLIAPDGTL